MAKYYFVGLIVKKSVKIKKNPKKIKTTQNMGSRL